MTYTVSSGALNSTQAKPNRTSVSRGDVAAAAEAGDARHRSQKRGGARDSTASIRLLSRSSSGSDSTPPPPSAGSSHSYNTRTGGWYAMVNVDLYSAIITIVPNAPNTLVSGEKPGFYRAMLWY